LEDQGHEADRAEDGLGRLLPVPGEGFGPTGP
jgi:hypothetical protein